MSLYSTILCWAHPTHLFREMSMDCCRKLLSYLQQTKGVDFKTESLYGCYLICDVKVDEAFQDMLSILPPFIHSLLVKDTMLSPFQSDLKEKHGIKIHGERLIADFSPKKSYIISAIALKMYLRAGAIVEKISVSAKIIFFVLQCAMI